MNEKQREAMETRDSVVCVIAGPGTGKTKTLVERIGWLLRSGVKEEEMGAITFTRKAARELRERLKGRARGVWVGTIHGLGREILGEETDVMDERRRKFLVGKMREEKEWKELMGMPMREVMSEISKRKMGMKSLGVWKEVMEEYEKRMRERGGVDFDDLIVKGLEKAEVRFEYLLVDEFQDVSKAEYELIKRVGRKLWVIGDPRQSIYGFRGAEAEVFKKLKDDFGEVKEIELEENYRSGEKIVRAMERLFSKARVKAVNQGGEVRAIEVLDGGAEGDWVVNLIDEKVGGIDLLRASEVWEKEDTQVGFGDFGIIYRTHGLGRVIKRKLLDRGIPIQMVGEEAVFEKRGIREVVMSLVFLVKRDEEELEEMVMEGWLSEEEVESVKEVVIEGKGLGEVMEELRKIFDKGREKIGDQEMDELMFLQEIKRFEEEGKGVTEFVDYVLELEEKDYFDAKAERVTLLTMHASKGLEFKYVVVVGVEEGLVPYTKKDTDMEEEKRLFYVAMSRAKRGLFLIHARQRGRDKKRIRSRFVEKVVGEGVEEGVDERLKGMIKRRRKQKLKKAQMGLF